MNIACFYFERLHAFEKNIDVIEVLHLDNYLRGVPTLNYIGSKIKLLWIRITTKAYFPTLPWFACFDITIFIM